MGGGGGEGSEGSEGSGGLERKTRIEVHSFPDQQGDSGVSRGPPPSKKINYFGSLKVVVPLPNTYGPPWGLWPEIVRG